MGRFVLSQLRHRAWRSVALGTGLVVAAVGFTLLTSAVDTGALQTTGTINESFRPAYDLLVRPPDSYTPIERARGLVRSNYLSGIYGGISMSQWKTILHLPGVSVAAPIANIGYVLPFTFVPIKINRYLDHQPFQIYRIDTSWLANNGTSRYPSRTLYVYYETRDPMVLNQHHPEEILSGGHRISPCFAFNRRNGGGASPFNAGELLTCFSSRSPNVATSGIDYGRFPSGYVGSVTAAFFPMLVSAVDPVQEDRLVNLGSTIVQGHGLTEALSPSRIPGPGSINWLGVPVIASTKTYVDERLAVSVQRLDVSPSNVRRLMGDPRMPRLLPNIQHGVGVGNFRIPISRIYRSLMSGFRGNRLIEETNVWAPRAVSYEASAGQTLVPRTVHNPVSVYRTSSGSGGFPLENLDVQFRKLDARAGSNRIDDRGTLETPFFRVVGRFDPARLPGFNPLSQVPLESYYPPTVKPADAVSRAALGGKPLMPTQNLGDYIAQPPTLLTNINGLKPFLDSNRFYPPLDPKAPISVIRVRVRGVTGADPTSLARIRTVATLIHDRTGLAVDITAGSSPHDMRIDLPAGRFGRPALTLDEPWVETGVAVRFLRAVDTKSLLLFVLVLIVCVLFLANSSFASVRARRREFGTLLCLGWTRRDITNVVLVELSTVGVAAGIVSAVVASLLAAALSLELPWWRLIAIVPIAVVLMLLAGLVPARRAAAATPIAAVQPPVADVRRSRRVSGIGSMAVANVLRLPSRTVLAASTVALGVATLSLLVAVDAAFQRSLVGTLLGHAISLEVRPVDFLSVTLVLALAALSVADVLYLNVRDRAGEFVTLRTSGWRRRDEVSLVVCEGLLIGLLGSAAGIVVSGIASTFLIRGVGFVPALVGAAVGVGAGTFAALVASVFPSLRLASLTPAVVLSEE